MSDRRQRERRQSHNPSVMLECPFCGSGESCVIETRGTLLKGSVRRRRQCAVCAQRFTTEETVVEIPTHTISSVP